MHYQGNDITKLRNVNGLCVGNASTKTNVADTVISEAIETGSTFC